MTPHLTLVDVACRRGGTLLFHGVSLALSAGDAVVVAGPNGCGKSSLLRMIAGLLPPFAGQISREGRVALLGENSALDGDRRLGAALRLWATLDGRADSLPRVADAMTEVGLDALEDVPVRLLSTGQRRRAAMARVIATNADIWLLDEPATGLDAASMHALQRAMARQRAAGGIIVVATHQSLDLPGACMLDLLARQSADA